MAGEVFIGAEVAESFLDAGAVPPLQVLVQPGMEVLDGVWLLNPEPFLFEVAENPSMEALSSQVPLRDIDSVSPASRSVFCQSRCRYWNPWHTTASHHATIAPSIFLLPFFHGKSTKL
ncbi:hypothetical protein P5G52_01900 [Arthrobacter sp. IIF3SC--B10]|uniref:Uncharacterized protein n=1 Tax=Arthrobacter burdickii TaxID=3035920 RepID=A0ABT8JWQ0_9MICC|nr:hypothetical protein [Arthrobacter burdickii]MDN4609611.1 hypothetical protein [Arthrobacter burdickii]